MRKKLFLESDLTGTHEEGEEGDMGGGTGFRGRGKERMSKKSSQNDVEDSMDCENPAAKGGRTDSPEDPSAQYDMPKITRLNSKREGGNCSDRPGGKKGKGSWKKKKFSNFPYIEGRERGVRGSCQRFRRGSRRKKG